MINLDKIKTLSKAVIVIRHAERDKMEKLQISQPLNSKGIKTSRSLGQQLATFDFKSIKYITSPVDRCIETCQYIAQGFNGEIVEPEITNILGEPGPFVIDCKDNAFCYMECVEVVEKQITGPTLKGFRSTKEGSEMIMKLAKELLDKAKENQLLVLVSHDAILAPFIYTYTGETFGKHHWLDFADGVIIYKLGNKYYINRNQIQYETD